MSDVTRTEEQPEGHPLQRVEVGALRGDFIKLINCGTFLQLDVGASGVVLLRPFQARALATMLNAMTDPHAGLHTPF